MPEWLSGPALGGAVVGLLWALARVVQRRGEAAAAQDEASAKAVVELVAQLGDLRRDLDREQAARERLQQQVDHLEQQLSTASSRCAYLEGQVDQLTREAGAERARATQAEARAEALAGELGELRRAIQGGHTLPSGIPPARS